MSCPPPNPRPERLLTLEEAIALGVGPASHDTIELDLTRTLPGRLAWYPPRDSWPTWSADQGWTPRQPDATPTYTLEQVMRPTSLEDFMRGPR